jgi:hypothetical protein
MPETQETAPADAVQQLTSEQRAVQQQRDQWTEANPGKSYRGSEWLNLGPEDIAHIQAAAERYGFDDVDRKSVEASYGRLQEVGTQRAADLRRKYEAEGYTGEAFEKLIGDKTARTVEDARLGLIERALPYPDSPKRRDIKKIDKKRENLQAMLVKSPDDFHTLQAEWSLYEDVAHTAELDRLHGEALKDDKSLKATHERSRIKYEMAELDDNNGGVLEFVADLPIEGDARTAEVLKTFQERAGRHSEDEDLLDADRLQALNDFKWRLGELWAQQSATAGSRLTDEQIKAKGDEAAPYIEDWLEAIAENGGDPLADLAAYKNKERAFENWDRRRRQAAEYLAPVIMMRSVRNLMRHRPETSDLKFDLGKTVKAVLDPNLIGEKNGASALRNQDNLTADDAKVYKSGILGQLETARNHSRHQGNMMKSALIFNAITIGAYNSLSDYWDRLSEEEKKRELRKKMLGKAAVGTALAKRIAAKAAKKAKPGGIFAAEEPAKEES